MRELSIRITNADGTVLAENTGDDSVGLVYSGEYGPGDKITLTAPTRSFLVIQLDDVMNPSFVYMEKSEYEFFIPFGEKCLSYNPKAFTGNLHLLTARAAAEAEIEADKNLAQNEYDAHENSCCFPHASANVETRGESVFAARNAIDGNTENHSHGNWPYESWGINRNPDAEIKVEFGRTVDIRQIILFTRADFPHDNWWKQADISFSDGTSETVFMKKSDKPHAFDLVKNGIAWLKISRLIKDENDPSPFPALTQMQVWGKESPAPVQTNGPVRRQ